MAGPWGWLRNWANLGQRSASGVCWLRRACCWSRLSYSRRRRSSASAGWRKSVSRARDVPARRLFVAFAYTAVPLGLAAWIAFSLDFLFAHCLERLAGAVGPLRLGLEPVRHGRLRLETLRAPVAPLSASADPDRRAGDVGAAGASAFPANTSTTWRRRGARSFPSRRCLP